MIRIPKKQNPPAEAVTDEASFRSERISENRRMVKDTALDSKGFDRENASEYPNEEKKTTKRKKQEEENKRPAVISAAFRILQSGANSKKMLYDKLLKKGFSKEECRTALEECEALGFLNDRRLLAAQVSYLARKKHYGKSRIRMALLQKFDRRAVEEYFDEALEEIDFSVYAREEAEQYCHRGKAYLVRRLHTLGYTSREIYEALEGIVFEDGSFDDSDET